MSLRARLCTRSNPMQRLTRGRLPALLGASLFLLSAGQAVAQADVKRGEKLFVECRSCHALDGSTDANSLGPALAGIIGRRAGAIDDFRYSPAIRRSKLSWTRQTLDAFIADPQAVIPGNRMPYSGLADAKERADLVAYLVQATAAK
jgi:cytochrome c